MGVVIRRYAGKDHDAVITQNLTFQNKLELLSLICHECYSNECTCLKNNNLHNGCINPQSSKPLQNEPRKVFYKTSYRFDPFELRGTCIEKIFKSGNVRDYDLYGPTSSFGHTKKGLRIGNIYVCHLNGQLDEIKSMLSNPRAQSIDILGICETFLNEKTPDSFLTIKGFNAERKDRTDVQGGGILIYLSENMSYKRRTYIEIGDIETIWVEVNFKNPKPILVCSAYRPPSPRREWIENFAKEINKASYSSDQELILMGDFNIDISNCPPKYRSSVFDQYDFKQIITNPTRVSSTRSTLIDHIYTNKPDNVCTFCR